MTNKKVYFFIFFILFIALLVRLINLGAEPFWGDEILSLNIVKHYQSDIPGMLTYLKTVELHPPLYYLILNGWARIFGWDEFGVRLLSVCFGLGVILLVYWLYDLLFKDKKMALLAAFFCALLPFQVEFSQEARPYIIFCFFALLATIFFWQYQKKRKIIFIFGYLTASLLGLYLHYSYFLFAAALACFWLFDIFFYPSKQRLKKILAWLITHTFIFLAYFFQFISLLYKLVLGKYPILGIERDIDFNHSVNFISSVIDQLIWLTKNLPITNPELIAILIFKFVFILSLAWLIIRQRDKFFSQIHQDQQPLLYMSWLTIASLFIFLISPIREQYTPIFERHVITTSVFLIILMVYLLSFFDFKKKLLLSILFLISLMNMLIVVVGDDSVWDIYFRIKSIADHINLNYQPGDIVLVSDTIARSDINYYLRPDISAVSLYPLALLDYHNDFLSSRETLGLGENESQIRCYPAHSREEYYTQLNLKMDYMLKKYNPQRIWYLFQLDKNLDIWFKDNDWRLVMDSLGHLHPVKLYARK